MIYLPMCEDCDNNPACRAWCHGDRWLPTKCARPCRSGESGPKRGRCYAKCDRRHGQDPRDPGTIDMIDGTARPVQRTLDLGARHG